MTGKNGNFLRGLTNLLAFIALVFISIALIAGKVSGADTNFSAICIDISRYAGYLLVGIASFWYVMSKRSLVLKIVWVICIAIVVVLMFI